MCLPFPTTRPDWTYGAHKDEAEPCFWCGALKLPEGAVAKTELGWIHPQCAAALPSNVEMELLRTVSASCLFLMTGFAVFHCCLFWEFISWL